MQRILSFTGRNCTTVASVFPPSLQLGPMALSFITNPAIWLTAESPPPKCIYSTQEDNICKSEFLSRHQLSKWILQACSLRLYFIWPLAVWHCIFMSIFFIKDILKFLYNNYYTFVLSKFFLPTCYAKTTFWHNRWVKLLFANHQPLICTIW